MEVNTINPDQTASREQSDLGRYSSLERLPKNLADEIADDKSRDLRE